MKEKKSIESLNCSCDIVSHFLYFKINSWSSMTSIDSLIVNFGIGHILSMFWFWFHVCLVYFILIMFEFSLCLFDLDWIGLFFMVFTFWWSLLSLLTSIFIFYTSLQRFFSLMVPSVDNDISWFDFIPYF